MASALGQALPEKLVGDLKGGANHVYMSGPQPGSDQIFLLYEYPAGGTGATRNADGTHFVRAYPEGDFNVVQAAEIAEAQCPVRIEHYGLREGSCGDGEFRGGCGMQRDIRILADGASLSVLADHAIIPPFGVAGGHSGAANRFVVERDGVEIEPSPVAGKVGGFALLKGDIVRMQSSGGGGYGDPYKREPERVRRDVELGYLSARDARQRFGVVLDGDGNVDAHATQANREQRSAQRVSATVQLANDDDIDGPRRRITLSSAMAGTLGVSDLDLVELSTPACGAALRAWVRIDDHAPACKLGPMGLAVLGAEPGDRVEIRAVAARPESAAGEASSS
jgi:N-methylhydantoinase B